MRAIVIAVAATFVVPIVLEGQLPSAGDEAFDQDYWYDVFYPKAFYSSRDDFVAGGYYGFQQPVRFEDFGVPFPYRASVSLNAQISTRGSGFAIISGRFPQFIDGWRFVGTLGFRRDARDNYFGIGNETVYDADNVTDDNPHFYQAKQTRWSARFEAHRYLTNQVRVLAGIDAQRWRFEPLDGVSVFANDVRVGTTTTIVRTDGVADIALRAGVIFDTRSNEVFAERGLLLQLIGSLAEADVVGQSSYTRLTFRAQGYYPISERVNLTGRFLAEGTGGTPGLGTLYIMDEQERATVGFGGGGSHRGLLDNRFIGRHKLLTNVDVRYTVFAIPTLVRITAVGFLDAGRVFEDEAFKLTTDGVKVGGGTGLFAQIGSAGIIGFTSGVGPDGIVLDAHTRWPF